MNEHRRRPGIGARRCSVLTASSPNAPSEVVGDGRGVRDAILLPGRVDHGEDARAERRWQFRPGVADVLQLGVESGDFRCFAQTGVKRNCIVAERLSGVQLVSSRDYLLALFVLVRIQAG